MLNIVGRVERERRGMRSVVSGRWISLGQISDVIYPRYEVGRAGHRSFTLSNATGDGHLLVHLFFEHFRLVLSLMSQAWRH